MSEQLSTIAIASHRKVLNMASSSLSAVDAKTVLITLLTVLIWCSHTPPMWVASGTFVMMSHCFSARNLTTLFSSNSITPFSDWFFPNRKFVPWLDRICLTAPLRTMKHLKAFKKASVVRSSSISRWMALEIRRAEKTISPWFSMTIFCIEGTKTVHSRIWK